MNEHIPRLNAGQRQVADKRGDKMSPVSAGQQKQVLALGRVARRGPPQARHHGVSLAVPTVPANQKGKISDSFSQAAGYQQGQPGTVVADCF